MTMEFRPCIDLHNGKVKQIVGSSLNDHDAAAVKTNFESDKSPAYYAAMYQRDGLSGGHVIMLGPGNAAAAKEALAAYPGGMQVGGGITAENAREWLDAGAAQIILTSYIFSDGRLNRNNLEKILKITGSARLVLDLSCRLRNGKYYIVTDRWQKFTDMEVNRAALKLLGGYCCEFLIHAVDVEGKQAGIDETLIGIMARDTELPGVYAGGIRSLDDIELVKQAGQGRISFTVGSALDIFGGTLKYRDVVGYCRKIR